MTTLFETLAEATRPVRIIPVRVYTCEFCGDKRLSELYDYEGFKICWKCYKRYNVT